MDLIVMPTTMDDSTRADIKKKISLTIGEHIVNKGLYSALRELIIQFAPDVTSSSTASSDLLLYILSIALKPLQHFSFSPQTSNSITYSLSSASSNYSFILTSFVNNILSIPYITNRLPRNVIQVIVPLLPLVLSVDPKDSHINTSNLNFLIGNLFSFSKLLLSTISGTDARNQTFPSSYINYLHLSLRMTSSNLFDSQDNLLQDQLKTLIDPFVLRNIVSTLLPKSTGFPRDMSELHSGLVHACGLFAHLLNSWKSQNTTILNVLSYSTSLVPNIWRMACRTSQLAELSDKPSNDSGLSDVLLLFAKVYSHLLITLDDDEFFQQQSHFDLKELVTMVQLLKKIAFRMYWKETKLHEIQLRDSLTALLGQLYDRNSRHIFCAESYWVETIPEFDFGSERMQNVLKYIPFVVPFNSRLKIFYDILEEEKRQNQPNPFDAVRVKIRRNYIFEDGFAKLHHLDSNLKKLIRVEYVSSNGLLEAGIDGGGLFKEFFTELIKTAYNTEYGLFREARDRHLYPNPSSSFVMPDDLEKFEFLGKILAKAVMENILVELPFANFFLAKLLGKFNYMNDLVFLDEDVHKNLMFLKRCEDVDDLSLNFTTIVDDELGEHRVKELIPGGQNVPVTNENKLRYIAMMANFKLNAQIKEQSAAFLRGFSQIIPPHLIRMFNQDEIQTIISGKNAGIDLEDLKKSSIYSGGYYETHPVIQRFWRVIADLDLQQQRSFLMFVTSCSRPPLLGFSELNPRFCIHKAVPEGNPDHYLPTASTCMNFLKIPMYSEDWIMKEKILYAINSKAGFELS